MIKNLAAGNESAAFRAIISNVTVGKTNGNNKSNYLNITLQDKSGLIEAKLWQLNLNKSQHLLLAVL